MSKRFVIGTNVTLLCIIALCISMFIGDWYNAAINWEIARFNDIWTNSTWIEASKVISLLIAIGGTICCNWIMFHDKKN